VPKDDQNIEFNPTQSRMGGFGRDPAKTNGQGFGQEGDPKVPTFDPRRARIDDDPKSSASNASPDVVSVKNARDRKKN